MAKSSLLKLTDADRAEGDAIFAEIRKHGGSCDRWDQADRTPALAAYVRNLITPGANCTAREMLEQFRRYGDGGMLRGGRLWLRPVQKAA